MWKDVLWIGSPDLEAEKVRNLSPQTGDPVKLWCNSCWSLEAWEPEEPMVKILVQEQEKSKVPAQSGSKKNDAFLLPLPFCSIQGLRGMIPNTLRGLGAHLEAHSDTPRNSV